MHDDATLLDALERFANDAGEFRAAITRMFLHHGERIVVMESALLESIKDRARLRKENELLRDDNKVLRDELRQVRYTVYAIVAIFVIAVLVQLWRG